MRFFFMCFILFLPELLSAQNFELLRYDERYSTWQDSSKTFYRRLKYIPLSKSGSTYLSVGGEIRQELDYAENEDWGEINLGRDVFLLQRYHLHADLHLNDRIRIFGQLRSGLEDGRKIGPRAIDEDKLNMQNLFVDIIPYKKKDRTVTVRLGRQEVQYGSGRAIDVGEGINLRLYFDGAKVAYASNRLNVDAFALAEAQVRTGVFDNNFNRKINLWGVYSTYSLPKNHRLDLYYLGLRRNDARFDSGVADESRHSIGARFSNNGNGFVYNYEVIYQFGTFGSDAIGALGLSAEVGYVFNELKGTPVLKLKSDYIPGDKNKDDGKLGTSNPFYPNGGYFGMNPQVGPVNLISIHPNMTWSLFKKLGLKLDVVYNYRQSTEDGVYRANGSLRLPSAGSKKRYVGTAYIANFSWKINGFLNYNMGVQYFKTGDFINDVLPNHQDGIFVNSVIGFKF